LKQTSQPTRRLLLPSLEQRVGDAELKGRSLGLPPAPRAVRKSQ
jgi:hypothetical protein